MSATPARNSPPGTHPSENRVDVIGGTGPRFYPGNEGSLLLQVLCQIHRVEDDRGVEVAEDQDQRREGQIVGQVARIEKARNLGQIRILGEARQGPGAR